MKCFEREWSRVKQKISGKPVYLFLDFDGTLTSIRKRPGDVRLSKAARSVLKGLASEKSVNVAVISGRRLEEIKRLVGVKNIIYAGNHGLEAGGPGFKFAAPKALKTKKIITELKKKLKKELRSFKGVIVEDKKLTLSVHFRMARPDKIDEIQKHFRKTTAPYLLRKHIVLTAGKMVLEVRPPIKWNKGKIVSKLLRKEQRKRKKKIIPFYIGDDKTDEDAFRMLGKSAYTVKVGRPGDKSSSAEYYLRRTGKVENFLKKLLAFKEREKHV